MYAKSCILFVVQKTAKKQNVFVCTQKQTKKAGNVYSAFQFLKLGKN